MSNAFAELFYSRELKNIITDLEGEQNLRREPLHDLNVQINIMLGITVVISFLMLVTEGKIVALIAAAIILGFIKFCVHFYLKYYKAFIYGEKQKFIVEKIKNCNYRVYTSVPLFSLICTRVKDGKKVKTTCIAWKAIEMCGIEKGKEITLYYSDDHKMYPAVDAELFKQAFCLRKDLMDEKQ